MHNAQSQSMLHPDRLLPTDTGLRAVARDLYNQVADAPILSPHGHCEAHWFASDQPFPDATSLMVLPDHYVLRMLVSQGVSYDDLGVPRRDGSSEPLDARRVWRTFAAHYHLFRATPSKMWLDHALHLVLGLPEPLTETTADAAFDHINAKLAEPRFRPRALYKSFQMELLATTDAATDDLAAHEALAEEGFGAIVPTFRPDAVTNPHHATFADSMARLAELTGENVATWKGYLNALRARRQLFKALGATATDHGVVHPNTDPLSPIDAQALLDGALRGGLTPELAAQFEAGMLFEMARMSADDGLVMQLHAGSRRNYDPGVFDAFGADKGFDIPGPSAWGDGLKPLLNAFGFDPNFQLILYTLDETSYGRELAPLAGVYPSVILGAPWWFFDSPEGMRRYRTLVTETAGFYNTAGFVDDTRAFLSIPARHDMFRRIEAGNLAGMVGEHVLSESEAAEIMQFLVDGAVRRAYRLPDNAG